ncbi:MAG: radical SAM protein [Candidatus Diapherotrites archaeon]
MFQKKNELAWNVLKKDGPMGVVNLGIRFIEGKTHPENVNFFLTSAQVELTTACNLRCTMCEQSHLTQNPISMKFTEFKKFLDNAPYIELINFTGIGEILLNPDWFKILEYSKQKGLYVWFNDNFTLMNKENSQKIIDLEIDALAVSFDGATKQIYEKIRRGANFEKVTANIKQFTGLKKALGKKKPEFFMVFVAMKENIHEMEPLIELAKNLGVNKVLFVGVITFEGTEDKSLNNLKKEEMEKIFEKTKAKAEELGITIMGLPSISRTEQEECDYPWVSAYITSSGEVLPCCFVKQRDKSEVSSSSMGNIKENSFKEIWKGKKYAVLRKKLKEKNYPSFCDGCYKLKKN